MTTATTKTEWLKANLGYLSVEFGRLRQQLGTKEASQRSAHASRPANHAEASLEPPPAIDQLCDLFTLSAFERDLLLLCAGVEMDSKLAAQCAEAQGHPQQTYARLSQAAASRRPPCASMSAFSTSSPG